MCYRFTPVPLAKPTSPPLLPTSPHAKVISVFANLTAYGVAHGVAQYLTTLDGWTTRFHQFNPLSFSSAFRFDNPDGVIIDRPDPTTCDELANWGKPVVRVIGPEEISDGVRILHDEYAIGKVAAEHLLDRGHASFAFLSPDGAWARGREQGFVETLARAGRPCALTLHDHNPDLRWSWAELLDPRRVAGFIHSLPRPLAVMTANDEIGANLTEICRRCDLRVPDDVAIVGVDNDQLNCRFSRVPLSSVDTDYEGMGFLAAKSLHKLILGQSVPTVTFLPPRGVVVRGSSNRCAVTDPDLLAALDLIRIHACNGLTVAQLAKLATTPHRSLERRFQQVLRRSPAKEIMLARIQHAQSLLRDTDLKIIAVSARCGFSYQSHFTAAFRRVAGTTPVDYRAKWRRSTAV